MVEEAAFPRNKAGFCIYLLPSAYRTPSLRGEISCEKCLLGVY